MAVQYENMFGIVDFIVFFVMLAIALSIGVYYAVMDRKSNDSENYNYGGRNMSPFPVGFSISVTFVSAITLIGIPTEVYKYGLVMFWFCFVGVFSNIVACVYYIPITLRLKLTTFYEYLEFRFHKRNRILASISEIVKMILYMGIAVYVPALALNVVTPLSIPVSIVLTSVVCTAYTALGGLKAVIWTDTLQSFIMLTGCVAAMVKIAITVGGFGNIWEALERGGRDNMFKSGIDTRIQRSFYNVAVVNSFGSIVLICNQAIMQRFMSCSSVKNARIASLVSIPTSFLFYFTSILSGCAAYAYFENCDPKEAGFITKHDQLMPYLVLTVFRDMPGMAGLFVSAAYSGTLSTVSSGINSVSVLIMEDLVIPHFKTLSRQTALTITKLTAVALGIMITCMSFLVDEMGMTIIAITISFFGASAGPLVGVFTLGYFLPWSNSIGAFVGQIVGTLFVMWIALGAAFHGIPDEFLGALPVSVSDCTFNISNLTMSSSNTTMGYESTTMLEHDRLVLPTTLYAISFCYHSTLGIAITIFIGLIFSFTTGPNKPSKMNPDYFVPLIDNKRLSAKVRTFFRFGVPVRHNKAEVEPFDPSKT